MINDKIPTCIVQEQHELRLAGNETDGYNTWSIFECNRCGIECVSDLPEKWKENNGPTMIGYRNKQPYLWYIKELDMSEQTIKDQQTTNRYYNIKFDDVQSKINSFQEYINNVHKNLINKPQNAVMFYCDGNGNNKRVKRFTIMG